MNNAEIRIEAMKKGVKQWQIAKALGISETYFCKIMRKELSQDKKDEIIQIIDEISKKD